MRARTLGFAPVVQSLAVAEEYRAAPFFAVVFASRFDAILAVSSNLSVSTSAED